MIWQFVRFSPNVLKCPEIIVVKSFRHPKGGTYDTALILDGACGKGTLIFGNKKAVLK